MNTIAAAFVKAKKAFGPALKDKTNPAFRSKYADLGACIDAVDDALLANGIAIFHETFEDMTGVTVQTVMLHESGEMLKFGVLHVPASKQDPQGYGSALTYARRYSLMSACGIAAEDDDGNAAVEAAEKAKAAAEKAKSASKNAPTKLTENTVADHIASITDATTIDDLKEAFAKAYKAAERVADTNAQERFEKAKDDRKAAIQNEIGAQA